jgi:hypothetical protein
MDSLVNIRTWQRPLESIPRYLLFLLLPVNIKDSTLVYLNYSSGFLIWPLRNILLRRRRVISSKGIKHSIFRCLEQVISFSLVTQTVLENGLIPLVMVWSLKTTLDLFHLKLIGVRLLLQLGIHIHQIR